MAYLPKSNTSARMRKLVAGANQHMQGVSSLTLLNVPYALAALLQLFTGYADLCDGAQAAQATYKDKLGARRAQAKAVQAIEAAFVEYVRVTYGASTQVLADFGVPPHKAKAPQTAEQKAQAVAKRDATRAARHTVGKRAKLAIHGQAAQPANGGAATPAPGNAGAAPAVANPSQAHGPTNQ
jgi:hypothetical protein